MIRNLLLFAVTVLVVAAPCVGQSPDSSRSQGLELLAIPEGQPIACRVPEVGSTGSRMPGAVIREFRFGTPTVPIASWPRTITVLFDSVGHALVISDEVNQMPRRNQGVIARLTADGQVEGKSILTTIDSVALADAIARRDLTAARAAARAPVSRDLLPSEAARVRPLAAWLWEHRCGRK
jgi:hypothetical protein